MSETVERDSPRYPISMVARLVGLSAHQLRVWERRYNTVVPGRTKGGARLYSETDVARLRALKELNERGHSIGQVARLGEGELAELLGPRPVEGTALNGEVAERVRVEFLDCIDRLDVLAAERVLSRAWVAFAPRVFVRDVILPVLAEIGVRWETSRFSVAHEHCASSVLRTQLGASMRVYTPDIGARVVVCATPALEQHEFGALAAGLSAASHGWKVVYLGANLPASEIVQAARAAEAELVLLSFVIPLEESGAELKRIRNGLADKVRIVIGGAAVARLGRLPKGVEVLSTISDLDQVL